MSFLKKQAAGFYITVLTAALAVASVVSYLINCRTDYFSKMENHFGLVVCILIAVVIDIIYIVGVNKKGPEKYFDVVPVVCGVLFMVAFALFMVARVSSIATILSFEKNAQTMSDLTSAIVGMVTCFLAAILNIAGAFCKVVKN